MDLQEVVDEVAEIPIEVPESPYKVKLGQIWVIDPQSRITGPYVTEVDGTKHEIYPMEARLRNLAYSAPIALGNDSSHRRTENKTPNLFTSATSLSCSNQTLLPQPTFTKKNSLRQEKTQMIQGGYFVVNGSERVIVAMEDLAPNRVIVDIDEKGTSPVYQAKIFSTTVGFRARIELKLKSDDAIYVTMPGVPTEIPFVVIMRALSHGKRQRHRRSSFP